MLRMRNPHPAHSHDIVDEKYQGPGAVVAGVGYGAIQTKLALFGGLIGGGVLAFIFHKPVGAAVDSVRSAATRWAMHENKFIQSGGNTLTWLVGHDASKIATDLKPMLNQNGLSEATREKLISVIAREENGLVHSLSESIRKWKWVQTIIDKSDTNRIDATIMGGGLFAVISMLGTAIWGGHQGYRSARHGRNQLTRAQDEIRHLRGELKVQSEAAANPPEALAKRQDTMDTKAEEQTTATPKTEVTSERAHHGTLHTSAAIAL
jgi:hypothetical protein